MSLANYMCRLESYLSSASFLVPFFINICFNVLIFLYGFGRLGVLPTFYTHWYSSFFSLLIPHTNYWTHLARNIFPAIVPTPPRTLYIPVTATIVHNFQVLFSLSSPFCSHWLFFFVHSHCYVLAPSPGLHFKTCIQKHYTFSLHIFKGHQDEIRFISVLLII